VWRLRTCLSFGSLPQMVGCISYFLKGEALGVAFEDVSELWFTTTDGGLHLVLPERRGIGCGV
jgi:hypothetical protein